MFLCFLRYLFIVLHTFFILCAFILNFYSFSLSSSTVIIFLSLSFYIIFGYFFLLFTIFIFMFFVFIFYVFFCILAFPRLFSSFSFFRCLFFSFFLSSPSSCFYTSFRFSLFSFHRRKTFLLRLCLCVANSSCPCYKVPFFESLYLKMPLPHFSVSLSISPYIHFFIPVYQFTHLHPFTYPLFIYVCIYVCIHLFIHQFTHISIYLPIHMCMRVYMDLSIFPIIYLSVTQ